MKNIVRVLIITLLMGISLAPSSARGQFFFMENKLVGKPAPDFTLDTLAGGQKNFKEFSKGEKTIIFFWATWCPHCRTQLAEMSRTKDEIAKAGLKLVLVNMGEKASVVQQYVNKFKVDFTIFLDTDSTLSDPYEIMGLPTFIFVDAKGIIRDVTHGLPEDYSTIMATSKNNIQKEKQSSQKETKEKKEPSFFEKVGGMFKK